MKREAMLKLTKRVILVSAVTATLALTAMGIAKWREGRPVDGNVTVSEQVSEPVSKPSGGDVYRDLEQLRKIQLPTYNGTYPDAEGIRREYKFVYEEDVLNLSKEFSLAIEDYFKAHGSSNWTNDDYKEFWPEDIEYMVAAIAFRESEYRTNSTNEERNCVGLMGINKGEMLPTLEQWLTLPIWAPNYPQIEFDIEKVDMFNPTSSIEYTYYNIGYGLANRFKKDKKFTDIDGKRKTIWTTLEYSEDMQNRLIIASHLYGMTNVVDSIYDRNYYEDDNGQKHKIPLSKYIYSDYVEDVLDKMYELKNTYEQGLSR